MIDLISTVLPYVIDGLFISALGYSAWYQADRRRKAEKRISELEAIIGKKEPRAGFGEGN
ncbi:hypothetical protein [Corynebacterium hindlerae]|uniref:hypothetical protein n=1 Tax=Corynebacterium hindlerae TaxID=699041 RepID=UPI001C71621D|nr:hypothetical protein [Corynebacterium hindlerae]